MKQINEYRINNKFCIMSHHLEALTAIGNHYDRNALIAVALTEEKLTEYGECYTVRYSCKYGMKDIIVQWWLGRLTVVDQIVVNDWTDQYVNKAA